jgi:hypothetical protein
MHSRARAVYVCVDAGLDHAMCAGLRLLTCRQQSCHDGPLYVMNVYACRQAVSEQHVRAS